jgi:hypothetical protein
MKACILFTVIFIAVGQLAAQCVKDIDCKGDRICVEGKCQEPQKQNPPCKKDIDCNGDSVCDKGRCVADNDKSQKSNTFTLTESNEHHTSGGFATGSAITGFVISPIILGLTIGSAATSGNGPGALTLGESALGLAVVSVPIIAVGGASARSSDEVNGLLGLRIAGWCGYGFSIATGAVMVGMALDGNTVPSGSILACGILATFSCLSLSIDNLVSGAQARKNYANIDGSNTGRELTFGIGPYHKNGAAMQLSLRF